MNTYTAGEPVEPPGHLVGRPVQCYDTAGKIFAGIVLAARYENENMFADVAVTNDQSRSGITASQAVWTVQRNLRLVSSADPQPKSFSTF